MNKIIGTETVVSPISQSKLYKKSLCDYVINVATGCLFGCPHCCIPSTPMIRTRQKYLKSKGVENPLADWGSYVFVREHLPEQLEEYFSKQPPNTELECF